MANLVYKTRANSSAQGKSRVYFTCHPDDFEIYFNKICDMILKNHNCAIWYDSEPNTDFDAETMDNDLSKVQLIAIPVTRKMLALPNRVRDREIAFANEHHIPILPLVMEENLDALFSEWFGDIQYLNPFSNDATAISFEEKLQKFLNSVLVSDDLAERIRAAFDAYIFLSYRKKDRKYAQELMRLIHKNDFCRDIAIWYDEFLVPGEDFNHAIAQALKKSDLFALVVTPNLVNEQNYIVRTEYPLAREEGKNIIPVELNKTDRMLLEQLFDNIPECVSAEDDEELSKRLMNSIKDVVLKEHKSSPEHLFFIGLAYFNGIDMEVDREKGLSLIKSAADSGLPEAIEKMVSVYRSGDGVDRDYLTSLKWQNKLADTLQDVYKKTPNQDNLEKLISALYFLGIYYYELGQYDLALIPLQKIEKNYSQFDYESILIPVHLALLVCGRICLAQANLSEAEEYVQKAIDSSEELIMHNSDDQYRVLLARTYHAMAFVMEEVGKLTEAIEMTKKALSVILQLVDKNGEDEYVGDLEVFYNLLASLTQSQGMFDEAETLYTKAFEYSMKTDDSDKSSARKRSRHAFLQQVGSLYLSKGLVEEARKYFEEGLILREEITKEEDTLTAWDELGVAYASIGNVYVENYQYDLAIEQYLKSVEAYNRVLSEAPILQVSMHLATSYANLAFIWSMCGDNEEAIKCFEKSLEVTQSSLKTHINNIGLQYAFARTCVNISSLYNNLGDFDTAHKYLERAEVSTEDLVKSRGSFEDYILLGEMRWAQFNTYYRMSENEQAEAYIKQAIIVFDDCYKKTSNAVYADHLIQTYVDYGRFLENKKDMEKALDEYINAEHICLEHYKRGEIVSSLEAYKKVIFYKLFSLTRHMKKYDLSEMYAKKLIKHSEKLYAENICDDTRSDLAINYECVAMLYDDLKRHNDIQAMLHKAIELRQAIYKSSNSNEDLYKLIKDYDKLGNSYRIQNNYTMASSFLLEAKKRIEDLLGEDTNTKYRDAHAVILYHVGMNSYSLKQDKGMALSLLEDSVTIFEELVEEEAKQTYVNKAVKVLESLIELYEKEANSEAKNKCLYRLELLQNKI